MVPKKKNRKKENPDSAGERVNSSPVCFQNSPEIQEDYLIPEPQLDSAPGKKRSTKKR